MVLAMGWHGYRHGLCPYEACNLSKGHGVSKELHKKGSERKHPADMLAFSLKIFVYGHTSLNELSPAN